MQQTIPHRRLPEVNITIQHKALHRNVLLIASTRPMGPGAPMTWKAYTHIVEAKSHEQDALDAYEKADGVALSESDARHFFHSAPFSDLKYAR